MTADNNDHPQACRTAGGRPLMICTATSDLKSATCRCAMAQWRPAPLDHGADGLAIGPTPHTTKLESEPVTDQLRTRATKLSTPQRTTMDTNEMSFALSDRRCPILGVKGSRVQISPARPNIGGLSRPIRAAFIRRPAHPRQASASRSLLASTIRAGGVSPRRDRATEQIGRVPS